MKTYIYIISLILLPSCNYLYQLDRHDNSLTSWSYNNKERISGHAASRYSRTRHSWHNTILTLFLQIHEYDEEPLIELSLIKLGVRNQSKDVKSPMPCITKNNIALEFDDGTNYLVEGFSIGSKFCIIGNNAKHVIELLRKHDLVKVKLTIEGNDVISFNIVLSEYEEGFSQTKSETTPITMGLNLITFEDIFFNNKNSEYLNSSIESQCKKYGYHLINTSTFSNIISNKNVISGKVVYMGYNMLYNNAWIPLDTEYSGIIIKYINGDIHEISIYYNDHQLVKDFLQEALKYGFSNKKQEIKKNNKIYSLHVMGNIVKCVCTDSSKKQSHL